MKIHSVRINKSDIKFSEPLDTTARETENVCEVGTGLVSCRTKLRMGAANGCQYL